MPHTHVSQEQLKAIRGQHSNVPLNVVHALASRYQFKRSTALDMALRRVSETNSLIAQRECHHQLNVVVPRQVDLEHAQAVLVYGYIEPNRDEIMTGSSTDDTMGIAIKRVYAAVHRRMGGRSNDAGIREAIAWLRNNRVLIRVDGTSHKDLVLKLNTRENGPGVTSEGRDTILACKRFLRMDS